MLRARVFAAIMGWFSGRKSLNKGPFFRRFSLIIVRFSRMWQKFIKMGSSPSKLIIKVGMSATAGN